MKAKLCGVLALLLAGCGSGETDRRDELGDEGEERYELVIVDAGKEAESPAPEAADSAAGGASPAAQTASPTQQAEPLGEMEPAPVALPDSATPAQPDEGPDEAVVFNPRGEYTVQIGVYQDAETAARLVRQLGSEGYPAYAVANPDNKGVRVRIGYFSSREDAERFGLIFKADRSMDFWIDRRTNEKF